MLSIDWDKPANGNKKNTNWQMAFVNRGGLKQLYFAQIVFIEACLCKAKV